MEYNTQLKELKLPEYGRNIHNMVDYCMTLETKEERTRCANAIIDIMGNMFPHLRDVNDFKHILWDHIAIISDFQLDIDYPYEVVKEEELHSKPDIIPYSRSKMKYRHYGKTLERMIQIAAEMPDGEEKDQFLMIVLTQMKKSYTHWNKDVNDHKIFADLFELSDRKIDLRESNIKLPEVAREANQQAGSSNNRRKKKKR